MIDNEDEEPIVCSECSSKIDSGYEMQTDDGEEICSDCIRICDRCNFSGTDNDEWRDVDNEIWCQSCYEDHAYYCDGCNEYTADCITFAEDSGLAYCEHCDGHLEYCDDCGASYENPCEEHTGGQHIHNYSYRPDPIFHTTTNDERLFFGFELEMEFSGYSDRRYAAEYASTALQGSAYLKEDGSLDTGFELVTNPMSFDYLMNEADDLWKVIEQLKNRFTARSYNTNTCGFHIHVSRTGFNGGSHMHRFLNLIYSNEFLFSKLAGRKSERWAKFDDVNGEQVEWERDKDGNRTGRYKVIRGRQFKRKLDGSSDRYSAVNTLNEATLELRIFKGTMSKTALLAHIQLAHASVEYTRGLSVADVRNDALHADNFIRYIQDHAEIYPDLLQRLESKELIGAVYLKREPIAMITEGVDERMAERYKEYMKEMEARQTSMISEEIAPPRPSMSEDMLDRLLNEYISSMGNSIGRNGTV